MPSLKSVTVKSLTLIAGLALSAQANERHFTYTYETATLPQGAAEIEVWNTARLGKTDFYSRLDQALEFEVGLTDKVQASLYLKWNRITALETSGLVSSFKAQGLATEIKWKLSDPSAQVIGSALYAEIQYNTDAIELEGKGIFDKRIGDWLFAANLVGAVEIESEYKTTNAIERDVEWEAEELEGEIILAAAYEIKPGLTTGLEFRNHSAWEKENEEFDLDHSALFLGPTIAYASKAWWVAFSVIPQIPALKSQGDSNLALQSQERLLTRLLFSLHI